jgi:hypothetical protein
MNDESEATATRHASGGTSSTNSSHRSGAAFSVRPTPAGAPANPPEPRRDDPGFRLGLGQCLGFFNLYLPLIGRQCV